MQLMGKSSGGIVISFVAGLLQVNESLRHLFQFTWYQLRPKRRLELDWACAAGKLLAHRLHCLMRKCATQALPKRVAIIA